MTCKNCETKTVWEFTNQTKLCKKCFCDYIERKVFRTIRKYEMLASDSVIRLKKENNLNYNVLKHILQKKFSVVPGNELVADNLSQIAEETFASVLKGNFEKPILNNKPLSNVSDAELELYAKLEKIDGKLRKKNEKVRNLFEKFMKKNPDLEINIVKASEMI